VAAQSAAAGQGASPEHAGGDGKLGAPVMAAESAPREEFERRLASKGMLLGRAIMIRIFKLESQLEVWMRKDTRFELAEAYTICNWSGALGPKLAEGDRQSPEGFYSISARQLHTKGRWPRSLDLGFPNTFDHANGRTGSHILLHGGCTSTGCYAMTDPAMEQLYTLTEAALRGGQERIPVHVFPFRMTKANLAAHAESEWSAFWASLKLAYDLFEHTHLPPRVSVCNKLYVVGEETSEPRCTENESGVHTARSARKATRYRRHHRRAASKGRARRAAHRNTRRARPAARAARTKARHATAGRGRVQR
jgi:murein L,D-transpeptidase YafK